MDATRIALLICVSATLVSCASVQSTKGAPQHRESQVNEKRCAITFERAQNFARYWPPGPERLTNIIMFRPGGMGGFRGYDLLGDLYHKGCASAGIAPDPRQAAIWYEHAALGHVPEAQYKLGRMIFTGDGIPADRDLGTLWLVSAAMEGDAQAANFLRSNQMEPPPPAHPSTFSRLEAMASEAAAASRMETIRTAIGIVAYVGAAVVTGAAYAQSQYRQTVVVRPKPAYCSSNLGAVVYGSWVSATITTFCR